jgi:hypothetical protein
MRATEVLMASPLVSEFTLEGYLSLIDAIRGQGYQVKRYDEAEYSSRHLIVRHDIDFDLDQAVLMAECEAKANVRATYFILLRTEMYNLFSDKGTQAVRRIAELGHDVGLHIDATLYGATKTALVHAVRDEASILSAVVRNAVTVFSFHRPSPDILSDEIQVEGLINAYNQRLFRDFWYCSDSQGGWRHGHPLAHPALVEGKGIHLLTHPVWWTSTANATPQQKLESFLNRRIELLDRELLRNCKVYKSTIQAHNSSQHKEAGMDADRVASDS